MTVHTRRAEVVELVNSTTQVSVEELAEALNVSRETIRRDLVALHDEGLLRKFHGGARSVALRDEAPMENPYALRLAQNVNVKAKIAEAAVGLFHPGNTLFIDTGTTTLALAAQLSRVSDLTVVTNSARIAEQVAANRANRVYLLGGAYQPDVGENLGPLVLEQIGRFRASHAVLTVGAIGPQGIMDFDLQEAEVARAMIARSEKVIIVADSTKFGQVAVFDVAPLTAIHQIVTDAHVSDVAAEAFSSAGIQLVVAQ